MNRSWLLLAVVVCSGSTPNPANADLNLGLLMQCKRYGDAFNLCDRKGMIDACTPEFGRQWARVPKDVLTRLPRGGSNQVVYSMRDGNGGAVNVRGKNGSTTFVLTSAAGGWKIADIYKVAEDGRPQSVKEFLDASLTSNEFIRIFRQQGSASARPFVTTRFHNAFETYSRVEIDRIREFLPNSRVVGMPQALLGSDRASVRCRLSSTGDEAVTFYLVQSNGWKVDDFSMDTRTTQIASFRDSLPLLVAATSFGDYTKSRPSVRPGDFTAPGPLLDALNFARTLEPTPFPPSQRPTSFRVAEDCLSVELTFPGRTVRMCLLPDSATDRRSPARLTSIEIKAGTQWMNVADMILVKQRLTELASWKGWFPTPKPKQPPKLPTLFSDPALQMAVGTMPALATDNSQTSEQPLANGSVLSNAVAVVVESEPETPVNSPSQPRPSVHVAPLKRTKRESIRATPYRMTPQQMTQQAAKQRRGR